MEEKTNFTESITANEGKNIAMISYITIIGLIIAFVINNEKKMNLLSFTLSNH